MPYITKEQLAKFEEFQCRDAALKATTERFLNEQMVAEIALQADNRALWAAIAEEHKMDLQKFSYRINYLTGEIICRGEHDDE